MVETKIIKNVPENIEKKGYNPRVTVELRAPAPNQRNSEDLGYNPQASINRRIEEGYNPKISVQARNSPKTEPKKAEVEK